MIGKNNEQKLVDILFEVGILTKENETLLAMEREEYCEWIRDQLNQCGVTVIPVGASWGVLR